MTERPEPDDQIHRMQERLDEVEREISEAEHDAEDIDPAKKGPRFIEEGEGEGATNPPL